MFSLGHSPFSSVWTTVNGQVSDFVISGKVKLILYLNWQCAIRMYVMPLCALKELKLIQNLYFSVVFTKTHLMCSYNDNQITLIYFTKPAVKYNMPEKLSRLEPKLQVLELAGPSGRRLDRKLSCNVTGDMVSLTLICNNRTNWFKS